MIHLRQNSDIDFIRSILIILMILVHIVNFGNAYPHLKAGILSFMMPTFLVITGYLVNINKIFRQFGKYLLCLILPYVFMVTGYSVLSYFLPVRDGITILSLDQICEKIFVTSIGPYWFIQTMIICGSLYYLSFLIICRGGQKMVRQCTWNHRWPVSLRYLVGAYCANSCFVDNSSYILFFRNCYSAKPNRFRKAIPPICLRLSVMGVNSDTQR